MNGAELIGRGDEEHAREIDVDLEVVIAERVILRGVEHLEQRRGGIALVADGNLVDLVEHEHRVHRASLLQRLHDASWNRADVGAPVAANLGFVAHAAERDADELPVHGTRDRLSQRRLADAGRSDEAENGSLDRRRRRRGPLQFLDGEIFDDAFFDLAEVVVILVEHRARGDRIEAILGEDRPRDVQHPIDVRAEHLVFGRRGRHPLQPIDFALRRPGHRFGQLRVDQAPADLLDVGLLAFAELRLYRLQLLPQVVLALGVGHLLLRGRFDLALHLEQRDLAVHRAGHRLQLRQQIVGLENLLLLFRAHVEQAREQIDEPQRVVDAGDQAAQFLREAAR